MRWTVHGERPIYECDWLRLTLVDVELPDGDRFDHHVVRMPHHGAGVIVHEPERGVLMLWRHRFITDSWGWEIPAGRLDPGESPEEAAAREVLEETGWKPAPLRPLMRYHPCNGSSDQNFHLFTAPGASQVGAPSDPHEAERIEWVPVEELRRIIQAGEMRDGMSLTGILYALTFGPLT